MYEMHKTYNYDSEVLLMIGLFKKRVFIDWVDYADRIDFMDKLGFQQETRRNNLRRRSI